MKPLLIINDPPYGTERAYNALGLAHALLKKQPRTEVTLFLMPDSAVAAEAGPKTPDGCYNVGRMLKRLLTASGKVLSCGTCMAARGREGCARQYKADRIGETQAARRQRNQNRKTQQAQRAKQENVHASQFTGAPRKENRRTR